jgi:hypothetical protein
VAQLANLTFIEEGRRKKAEGRRQKAEGKKEKRQKAEGRRQKEKGKKKKQTHVDWLPGWSLVMRNSPGITVINNSYFAHAATKLRSYPYAF